ncbi:tat-binding homolog 7 [Phtheirospermum japonicum]|uniref:Tat-binding homolog 7 n=1 Tax=Phtheirospermum japonicum TaxID=374723 RepID=A0A830B075_9LAMI|nr:tat-binding homolog 7 [Phtheirospermum japonicum]
MRLSQSESVVKSRKDQKLRSKFKGKKKHKKLDAICEKSYSSSHKGVEKVEPSELNNGGCELELRRSNRARKAPVLLDSSPVPPKKRRKVDRSVQCETPCSSSRDVDEQNDGWRSRLRFRGKSAGFSGRDRVESPMKGKRKLFEYSDDGSGDDDMDPPSYDKKDGSEEGEKSTVVKSKRPGRIKASNVLANENTEIDEVLEAMDDVDGLHLEVKLECGNENGVEIGHVDLELSERDETAVQRDSGLEECHTNENVVPEKLTCDVLVDQGNVAEVDCAPDDQEKGEGHPDKPLGDDEACNKLKGKCNVSAVVDRKPRIKLGRRCGLCGGGTDGKPPRILLPEGAGSDNEAYSGSSGSEEPNYDVLDGFGDQPGWLGRLLGPINDRFGIAGIWVHQQCAVWSPEVYFAGLGCLKNVRAALYRGRVLKCSRCGRPGATIGCRVDRCPKTYHLPCARSKSCIFDHRKFLIACTNHRRLFQPHGVQNAQRLKKMKAKKLKLELRKVANDACRKDIEAEEKWLENCGEDEEFLKRESKRLHRDLWRIAPTYIGGANSEPEKQFQGWESVAGLQDVIGCMKEVVILPLLYPEFFSNIGLTPPRGVLLHGHPGTGKTLVVRALVGSCARGDRKIAYFARKGADCLGKYVGDAERQLRLLFQVAEKSQPSIIFFDEIDGLAPCRTKQQDQTHNSVVSTLLALMDGLKSRGSVIVIGATNRPDAVDPALRRPGRFDREIYFPLPSVKDREAILSLHTQKWPKPVTGTLLKWVAHKTVGFAGADLQALCTQAAIIALRRSFPLHEVLSAAEKRAAESKCPAIPSFSVEERDWLKALSCAPPPCSRRESGIALNDVVSSPLEIHLVPCLLVPLTRLLVRLYLDERVWLPSHLKKAATLVKDIIVSALCRRSVQSQKWWLHTDDLLREADVTNEIEKNILLANVLVGESNLCGSNVREDGTDEGCSNIIPSKSQCMGGARPGLLQNISNGLCDKSGFQVLICGNPRSGQRHLASCLLHYFVGDVDVWKIDLAGISHEGHGDMVLGLTHILMRCARSSLCLLYMPMIDLWAIETHVETSEDVCEVDMENGLHSSSDVEATWSQPVAKKASYIWTSFIEQLESMRVNTPFIILATSELPLSSLPDRITQFFGNETNCSLPSPLDHKVPRFSVQLDGNFNHDKVINSSAAKLTKDLAQHFVQSLRGENHNYEKSEKSYDMVEGDASRSCHIKPSLVTLSTPVVLSNKAMKGKSSLSLAISTFGYQILCYPHFAELCWVTSKLKDGPCANTNGPWKGWPFNSCIVRPINSTEKVAVAQSGSSSIKTKESVVVRGLVAVALSAYRGEYTSLKEVCSEVRKVLETLVGQIDDKIQAGKDRSLFIRILSQVAYLEDMIISWAHALYSPEEVCAGRSDPTADVDDNGCADAGDEVAVTVEEDTLASNEVNLESFKRDGAADHAETVSVKLSNGFCTVSGSDIQADGPFGSGENMISKPSSTCSYECCSECFVNLHNLLLRIINIEWGVVKGSESTIEDVHDFVASLSAKLFLSLSKLFERGLTQKKGGEYRKGCTSECENSDKLSMVECGCHATTSRGVDSRFVFKDGVLAAVVGKKQGYDYSLMDGHGMFIVGLQTVVPSANFDALAGRIYTEPVPAWLLGLTMICNDNHRDVDFNIREFTSPLVHVYIDNSMLLKWRPIPLMETITNMISCFMSMLMFYYTCRMCWNSSFATRDMGRVSKS